MLIIDKEIRDSMSINSKGVTIIELMVSVLIFGIGIAAIFSVCTQSVGMARKSDAAYTAYNLAKNRIETLRSVAFSDLSSAAETSTLLDAAGTPDPDGTFKRSTTVTTNYQGDANLISVDVTVSYQVRGEQSPNPLEMATVLYKNA